MGFSLWRANQGGSQLSLCRHLLRSGRSQRCSFFVTPPPLPLSSGRRVTTHGELFTCSTLVACFPWSGYKLNYEWPNPPSQLTLPSTDRVNLGLKTLWVFAQPHSTSELFLVLLFTSHVSSSLVAMHLFPITPACGFMQTVLWVPHSSLHNFIPRSFSWPSPTVLQVQSVESPLAHKARQKSPPITVQSGQFSIVDNIGKSASASGPASTRHTQPTPPHSSRISSSCVRRQGQVANTKG